MLGTIKTVVALGAVVTGAGILCPLCETAVPVAQAESVAVTQQTPDTASVRLHISGMTCGTCPVTARLALTKLAGVYSAVVTLDDSLGVVRYNPRRLTRDSIATHLTKVTGYGAKILPDSSAIRPKERDRES